jgi:hypothetical protein
MRIELITLTGKLIKADHPEGQHAAMDLTGMAQGMYLLKIYPETGMPVMKRITISE